MSALTKLEPSTKLGTALKLLFIFNLLFTIWSYSLTDPNLVLTSWPPYWQFQQRLWQYFFQRPTVLSISYTFIVLGLFVIYSWGLSLTAKLKQVANPKIFWQLLLALTPLLFAYNALSHDVFNYIFNAKMVLVYKANPHIQVALDFAQDDWTRFMHNTHTPAPYGLGWTGLSLLPYLVGLGKFSLTWLAFRAWSVVSVVLLYAVLVKFAVKLTGKMLNLNAFWLLFANPLFFIEVIANQHNDLWMMVPALASLLLVIKKPTQTWATLSLSLSLLVFSIFIKMATVVLLPIWLIAVGRSFWPLKQKITADSLIVVSSMAMFIPLFTLRSQQFLPWYLLWALVWLPLLKNALWRRWLVVFSISAMLRYLPWLAFGGFDSLVIWRQKLVLWGGGISLWLIGVLPWFHSKKMRYNKSA